MGQRVYSTETFVFSICYSNSKGTQSIWVKKISDLFGINSTIERSHAVCPVILYLHAVDEKKEKIFLPIYFLSESSFRAFGNRNFLHLEIDICLSLLPFERLSRFSFFFLFFFLFLSLLLHQLQLKGKVSPFAGNVYILYMYTCITATGHERRAQSNYVEQVHRCIDTDVDDGV